MRAPQTGQMPIAIGTANAYAAAVARRLTRGLGKRTLDEPQRQAIGQALGRIPSGLFILTAQHEERRTGILASWVQQAGFDPPTVSVAVAKGRPIMPLISESRRFGLCQLAEGERIIRRKFSGTGDAGEDPFLGLDMLRDTVLDVPILSLAMAYLECEVVCHVDVEGDHDMFIGAVRGGRYLRGEPLIYVRKDGFKY